MMRTPLLGHLDVEKFMAEFWQKKPCIIRKALKPEQINFLNADEIAGLSMEEEIESRLITTSAPIHQVASDKIKWSAKSGPFSEETLTALPEQNWSLLIQSVDLWIEEYQQILDWVNFIPRWRLDDVMISLAMPGGGVGPHRDQYDVFLIQAQGKRQWKVAPPSTDPDILRTDNLLQVDDFEAEIDETFDQGDVLYIPIGWLHSGTAITETITCSIGFRAPSAVNLMDITSQIISESPQRADWDRLFRFSDPWRIPNHSMAIHTQDIIEARQQLMSLMADDRLMAEALATMTTTPKIWPTESQSDESCSLQGLEIMEETQYLQLTPSVKMTYYQVNNEETDLFVNGETFKLPLVPSQILDELARHHPVLLSHCLENKPLSQLLVNLINEGAVSLIDKSID